MERNARNNNSLAEISESKPKKGSKNNRKCNNQPDPNCFALFFSCVIFCVYLVAKLLLLHEPRSLIFGVLFQSLALPPAARYTFYPVEALVSYLGLRCDGLVWLVILNYISERRKKRFPPHPHFDNFFVRRTQATELFRERENAELRRCLRAATGSIAARWIDKQMVRTKEARGVEQGARSSLRDAEEKIRHWTRNGTEIDCNKSTWRW